VLVLTGSDVRSLLLNREADVVRVVRAAYVAHAAGCTSVPHSLFLRFPHDPRSRIIALPAYLESEGTRVAGVKWVSSFPGNVEMGLERASAVVVLNAPDTGLVQAVLEASAINAKRTAASAALAATVLHPGPAPSAGLIGCGPINFETARFLLATRPDLEALDVVDVDRGRAERFRDACRAAFPGVRVEIADSIRRVLEERSLVAFATNQASPHVDDLSPCPPGAVVLHISLRDLAPDVILACDNVTDDADHVCRERTSLHLAEQVAGGRDFIRCSLGEILAGASPARPEPAAVTVFSPFGLGILDLAVADMVHRWALERDAGTRLDDFATRPGLR
jgi:2,3-diaminopropionate biosynthesis protein SbnB